MKSGDATAINIPETKADTRTKAGKSSASVPIVATSKVSKHEKGGWKRGIAIFDFILRIAAITATLAATTVMGTTDQTLPIFTQFFQFHANADDFPALTYFIVANGIASGYLAFSLLFSIVSIIRPTFKGSRLLLIIFDTVMVALISSGAAAAAAIVYLAHNGNSTANWIAMCQQFDQFCQDISGAVVASFVAALILIVLVIVSALVLRKQ